MGKSKSTSECATQDQWRPMRGHESFAMISRSGDIRTVDRTVIDRNGKKKLLKAKPRKASIHGGSLCIRIGGEHVLISRAVAATWIRPLKRSDRVVYLDGDITNVNVDNLRIVKRHEARRYMHNRKRAARNRNVTIQLRGEIWRPVPDYPLHSISNFGRVKSRSMQPPILLKVVKSPRSSAVVWLHRDSAKTSARSISGLMREVWPELAHEYPTSYEVRKANTERRKEAEKAAKEGLKNAGKTAQKQVKKR